MPSMMRGGSGMPRASWSFGRPSWGLVTNASGCQKFLIALLRAGAQRGEHLDLIAQPGGLLEVQIPGRLDHLLFHLREQALLAAFEELDEAVDVLAIGLLADPARAGRGALLDGVEAGMGGRSGGCHRRSEISRWQVRKRKTFWSMAMACLEPAYRGERTVELHPLRPRLARDVDAGEVLIHRDHQVGIGLVVEQAGVELGLDVLDQAVLGQQCLDLGVGLEDLEVDDLIHQPDLLVLELGRGLEVAARRGRAARPTCPRRSRGPCHPSSGRRRAHGAVPWLSRRVFPVAHPYRVRHIPCQYHTMRVNRCMGGRSIGRLTEQSLDYPRVQTGRRFILGDRP